jgi:hypothetical protein
MTGRSHARWIAGAALVVIATAWPRAEAPGHEQAPCDEQSTLRGATPIWRVPADAAHGSKELETTTAIVFPPAIPAFTVEIWGAGGGGGGGSLETISEGGYGGGGGASGSYGRTTLSTTPGATYIVVVGRGGAPGAGRTSTAGKTGGPSALCDGGRTLAIVAGGTGGQPGEVNHKGGEGGRPGEISADGDNLLRRAGNAGTAGNAPLFDTRGAGGTGGKAVPGTLEPKDTRGGNGGAGAITSEPPSDGQRGGDGHAVLAW